MPVYQNHVYGLLKKIVISMQYIVLRKINHVRFRSYKAIRNLTAELQDALSQKISIVKPINEKLKPDFPINPNYSIRNRWNIYHTYQIYSAGRKLQPLVGELFYLIGNQNYQNKLLNQSRFRRYRSERLYLFRSFSLISGLISRHITRVQIPVILILHLPLETL